MYFVVKVLGKRRKVERKRMSRSTFSLYSAQHKTHALNACRLLHQYVVSSSLAIPSHYLCLDYVGGG